MKHLLIDISGHGFGHLAQTACVVNELLPFSEKLQITIRSSLPENIVRQRLKLPFDYLNHELDKGMVMKNAVEVDIDASLSWYQKQHARYAEWLNQEVENIARIQPDLMLCNIPYISIEAASQLGIKTFALCSLNWFDILKSYCEQSQITDESTRQILKQIKMAYSRADCFFRPQPSLEMPEFDNTLEINAIASKGFSQPSVLADAYSSYDPDDKFVLVSMGGISSNFSLEKWPVIAGVKWVMPDNLMMDLEYNLKNGLKRSDLQSPKNIPLSFIDLLSSVDLVITKTGYGTLVEAVSHKKPVLCVERGDWPEEEVLFPWCKSHGYLEVISQQNLEEGNFANVVIALLKQEWQKDSIDANGAYQVAQKISETLEIQSGLPISSSRGT